jgi:hypothetical protein
MRFTTILRQSFLYCSLGGRTAPHDRLHSGGRPTRGAEFDLPTPSWVPQKLTTHWFSPNENNDPFHITHKTSRFKAVTLLIQRAYEIFPITSTLWGFSTTQTISFHGNILTLKQALNKQRNGNGIEADTFQSH